VDNFTISDKNKADIRELMRMLQEDVIPKYKNLLEIDFPNEQELENMKGLREIMELAKPIIETYSSILQSNLLEAEGDQYTSEENISVEVKAPYEEMMAEELNEQNQ
jgi:hypothetical protein